MTDAEGGELGVATTQKPSKKPARPAAPVVVPKNAYDVQRLKLERLMEHPDRPVVIPEPPKPRAPHDAPEFVRNVMGSSAGAGSGEFHVYRHLRRKEYARQKHIDQRAHEDQLDAEFRERVERNRREAEERTAKKRAKRQRRKQKLKERRTSGKASAGSGAEPDAGDGSSSEDEDEQENDDDSSTAWELKTSEDAEKPPATTEVSATSDKDAKICEAGPASGNAQDDEGCLPVGTEERELKVPETTTTSTAKNSEDSAAAVEAPVCDANSSAAADNAC